MLVDHGLGMYQRVRKEERKKNKKKTNNSRPNTGNRQPPLNPLSLKIHSKSLREHTHADFAHGVRRLATKEAAVDGRADDDDSPAGGLALHDGEDSLDGGVEAFYVDALHQVETLEGGVFD